MGDQMRIRSMADVAAAVRGRRLDRGLSQSELAEMAGVSRKWISELEAGKPTVETVLVIRILEALELHIELSQDSEAAETSPGTISDPVDLDVLLDDYRRR
jgi:HTH-type transcriptional regulator / antitoxin HipB